MYFKPVLQTQYKALQTQESRTTLRAEPGAGSTYTLLLKAIKEAQDGKFCVYVGNRPQLCGGGTDQLTEILRESGIPYRLSLASQTFQIGFGKIKVMSWHGSEFSGMRPDWYMLDHNAHRAETLKFSHGVKVISLTHADDDRYSGWETIEMRLADNFFIKESCPQYEGMARTSIPEKFFKD